MAKERVLVLLGLRMNPDNPMPATITQWPKGKRKPAYQYLSLDQLDQMDGDTSAIWEAEFLDGHYWLERRLPDQAPIDPLRRRRGIDLSDEEIPF